MARKSASKKLVLLACGGVLAAMVSWNPAMAGASLSPIQPGNRPTAIPGATNGELPASDLVNVAPDCQAARAAAPSLGLLLAEARERNVVLGTEQCYRGIRDQEAQQQAWTSAGNSACAAPVTTSGSGQPQGTSMHGWGKATDFFDSGGSLRFGSPGYQFLKQYAGQVGWNHPGWAEPGGSACPEAWHWEWVGDGGTMGATPIHADVVGLVPSSDRQGYATVSGLGSLITHGDFVNRGDAGSMTISWLIVGAAPTPDGGGYWLVASDGGVFSFGDAHFYGSTGSIHLKRAIVGMAPTPDGKGYWLVASDGGVFSFGDARFYGSTGNMALARPIVGMSVASGGKGYWLVASDGGVFTFGAARFHGSTGAIRLNQPIVGMASTPGGGGYWLVGSDGGVYTFGDAEFAGSSGGRPPPLPVVSITTSGTGSGYWITAADGEVLPYGNAYPNPAAGGAA
jgi:hypothetical protein